MILAVIVVDEREFYVLTKSVILICFILVSVRSILGFGAYGMPISHLTH